MHEDEFQANMVKLVRITNDIDQLPVTELIKELQAKAAKLRFQNTQNARQAQKTLDMLLGLARVVGPIKTKVKRPLRTLFRQMPELKDQLHNPSNHEIWTSGAEYSQAQLVHNINSSIHKSIIPEAKDGEENL